MTRTLTTLKRLALACTASLALLPAADAAASSITVGRTPAPPSAVLNDGSHALTYNADIAFLGSTPDRYTVDVRRLDGDDCLDPTNTRPAWFGGAAQSYSLTGFNGTSYSTGPVNLVVPAGAAQNRYCLNVTYFQAGQALFSSRAGVAFDVAQATGTVRLISYEDLNADGIRQGDEPGLSGWNWQTQSPAADGVTLDTTLFSTSADGSITIPNAITGSWNVSELLPNPNPEQWRVTTPTTDAFTLASGQTHTTVVGQVRPTRLCGTVWADRNANGVVDADEKPLPGITVALDGRAGNGEVVGKATTTDSVGAYCFDGLIPGSYNVTETIPADFIPTFDKDGSGNGLNYISPIVIRSGQPSAGNDFGLAPRVAPPIDPPVVVPPPAPQTKLCLTKKSNKKSVKQGQSVTWTIKVTNCGSVTANKAAVSDPLLSDTTLGKHRGAALVRGELVWATGTLTPGQSRTYEFTVKFDRDAKIGKHTNRANAEAANAALVNASASTKVVKVKRAPRVVRVTG